MYRKIISTLVTVLILPLLASAQKHGYDITVDAKGLANQKIFLAMYYGRPSTVYKQDSVLLDKKGHGRIARDTVIDGGLYIMLDSSSKHYRELILNDGDKLVLSSAVGGNLESSNVTGSDDNKYFNEYRDYLKLFEVENNKINSELAKAKTQEDTLKIQEKLKDHFAELNNYRSQFMVNHPSSFVASIFGAIYEAEAPEGVHYLPDGTVDSFYQYRYVKKHYWDKFPFGDARVAYSPIYHDKLERYFERLVPPKAEDVAQEAMWLLDSTESAKSMFNYTLWFVNRYIWNSKIMGLNEAIIPIAEKYYGVRDNVFWLKDDESYEKMMEKITLMKPNTIGNVGNNLKLNDEEGNTVMLHNIPADYLVMVFWAPDCGHCRKELPQIDSLYDADMSDRKDIQLVGIKTDGDSSVYTKFIEDHDLTKNWILLNDDDRESNYRYWYDVESTPTIFILNPERKIIAKRINFSDIKKVIDYDKSKGKLK